MKVFLSYSEKDRRWAEKLSAQLEKAGFKVWYAERELLPGTNWAEEMERALAQSDAMVALVSPDAVVSRSFLHEIEYALGSQHFAGRLIPVIVRPTSDIPWILERLSVIQLDNDPVRAGRLIAEQLKAPPLLPRQKEILRLMAQGFTNREIAEHLGISVRTVEAHRLNLMRRLKVRNVSQRARTATH